MKFQIPLLAAIVLKAAPLPFCHADGVRDLLDLQNLANVSTQDAKLSITKLGENSFLQVQTGHAQPWPGITLKPAQGLWDLSPFAAVEVAIKNDDATPMKLFGRVDNPGAAGDSRSISIPLAIPPGATATLRMPLKRESSNSMGGWLFAMRGFPTAPGGPNTINPVAIKQIMVFLTLPRPDTNHNFEIQSIRAVGTYVPPTASLSDANPYFPFIDTFGQYKHKDWPGKTHSLGELLARRDSEAKELAAHPGSEQWDQYGGYKNGPQLKATGFFRTEKYQNKWWLVDPEGRLFFSTGLDSIRLLDPTGIQDRENWFDSYPGAQPELAEFQIDGPPVGNDYYAGKNPRSFWFQGANLRRKYGSDWRQSSADVIQKRLRSWGFNTFGNWSDATLTAMKRAPYTAAIYTGGRPIAGSKGYWGQFPDPFDAKFIQNVQQKAASLAGKSANDPWCLGYFSDNELSWGSDTSLAEAALTAPADQPAKIAFVSDLKAKYTDIAKLNAVWDTNYASWEALLSSIVAPDAKKARPDLNAFYTRIAEQYFRTVRDALKQVAPNQLYLGCRFSLIAENPSASAAAAKFCDVVSYNVYKKTVDDFAYDGGADVPLLVGEFHFGALDRGLFHAGSVPVENQAQRAAAFTRFVQSALNSAQYVGVHWFEYNDEATTGRVWDGENYQIGFVDIADTPYSEMVEASRAVTRDMYQSRLKP